MPRTELRKTRVGVVRSTKMMKTIVVEVDRLVKHPLYRKTIRRSTKLHAHDEKELCGEGDLVRLMETRPLSKTKCWRVVEILKQEG